MNKSIFFNKVKNLLIMLLILSIFFSFSCSRETNERIDIITTTTSTETPSPTPTKSVDSNPFDLVANAQTNTGVDTYTHFILNTDYKTNADNIKSIINTQPKFDFIVTSETDNKFIIKPKEQLLEHSIYNISINDSEKTYSWAFQTITQPEVMKTIPRNKSNEVPINTGIEIIFNVQGINNIKDYFEITPKAEGIFKYEGNTCIFVPNDPLNNDTIYKVTLKKGIKIPNTENELVNDYVFEFQTKSQNEYDRKDYFFSIKQINNYSTSQAPSISILASDSNKEKDVSIKLYRYRKPKDFITDASKDINIPSWTNNNSNEEFSYIEKTDLISTFSSSIISFDFPYYINIIEFPEAIEEGHYAVELTCNGLKSYTYLQIKDLSVYVNHNNLNTICWVNNTKTHNPISDLNITFGNLSKKTNSDGIAVMENRPETDDYRLLTIEDTNSTPYYSFIRNYNNSYYSRDYYSQSDLQKDYWSYLYTDRGMYLPTDTINFWGMIEPRDSSIKNNKYEVAICKDTYAYKTHENTFETIKSKEIKLDEYGSFNQSISINELPPGSFYVVLRVNDEILEQNYIKIHKYTKPLYKMETSVNTNAVMAGEAVTFNANVSYFEGTPTSGFELETISYGYELNNNSNPPKKVITNIDGNVAISIQTNSNAYSGSTDRYYETLNLRLKNTSLEKTELRQTERVKIFIRDKMITTKAELSDNAATLNIEANTIDISNIKNTESYYDGEQSFKGVQTEVNGTIKFYEQYYIKTEIGTVYDYINKVTHKHYNYSNKTKLLSTNTFETIDSTGIYTFDIPTSLSYDGHSHYYAIVHWTDSQGRKCEKRIHFNSYIYNDFYSGENAAYPHYSLNTTKDSQIDDKYDDYYNDTYSKYIKDELFEVSLNRNRTTFNTSKGQRVLYMIMQDGIIDYTVSDSTLFSRNFNTTMIPNFYFGAVFFDGNKMNKTIPLNIHYDYSEKELDIKVETDKAIYTPGDTVTAKFVITDSNNQPVKAKINLSVVDEAFFALRDQNIQFLKDLYKPIYTSGIISEYISNIDMSPHKVVAECGEGGDDRNVRSDFKDNAFFGDIETDAQGIATFSFKLPDNLTSWRLTYHAVTETLDGNNGQTNISCSIPFFTNIVVNKYYRTGDKPQIPIKSSGKVLSPDDKVDYTINIESEKEAYKTNNSSYGNEPYLCPLKPLKSGVYDMTVYSTTNDSKDALMESFEVFDNRITTTLTDNYDLTKDSSINNPSSLSTITIMNTDTHLYYKMIMELLYAHGNRVDQKISQIYGKKFYKQYFNSKISLNNGLDLLDYQQPDGGISLLPYSSSEIRLSAKIALIGADYFNKEALAGYFYRALENENNTATTKAAAFLGLSALKEPVLYDIYELINKDMPPLEKLYITLALSELGDFNNAGKMYDDLVQTYSKIESTYCYLNYSKSYEENLEATALLGLAATKLHKEERLLIQNYLVEKDSTKILTNLETVAYFKHYSPKVNTKGSFSYTLLGEKHNITINGIDTHRFVVTKENQSSIKFSNIEGNLVVSVAYEGSANILKNSHLLSINRQYILDKTSAVNTINARDKIDVVLDITMDKNAPHGYYKISDVLPGGLIYIPGTISNYGNNVLYVSYDGLVADAYFYYGNNFDNKLKNSFKAVYSARVMNPGEFSAEPAVVKHVSSDICAFTEEDKFTIKAGE